MVFSLAMKTRPKRTLLCAGLLSSSLALAHAQSGPTVVQEPTIRQQVEVRDVIAAPERVQGLVVNHTDAILRNVVLLVRYDWLWLNERNPGEDTMSFAETTPIAGDIPSGGSAGFAYMPTRMLPNRQDGYYKIDVSVQSFRKARLQAAP